MKRATWFPLFVDLAGKTCVVVGGGQVAARRAAALSRFGAQVVVISPDWQGKTDDIDWMPRSYQEGDLTGAFLAVAATDSRAVNQAVGEEARRRGIPVSVADRKEESSFFFPALCEGGGVTAGLISREGTDHRLAHRAARAVRITLEELEK